VARRAPILAVSSFYATEPVGYAAQPHFLNAVAAVAWRGTPERLLGLVKRVERIVGRTRTFTDGPREIDVDILDLGGLARSKPDPVLPHPRLSERRFALAPLSEIAPDWRHPATGRSAAELLAALPARPRARRLSSRPRGSSARSAAY
jgi:2-amino-4-hydroxy-6-hydroxymethyldihydropteridine diphosphokinase